MNKQEIIKLLTTDNNNFEEVAKTAHQIRKDNLGDTVFLRAILEFSNYCKRECRYCGLNRNNKNLIRYRMTKEQIIKASYEAAEAGYKSLVMQSGEDGYFTPEKLAEIVKEVAKTGMTITLSCGEMSKEAYALLKEAGVERYLLKHETSDRNIYNKLHPCGTLENRIECLKNLKSLGYATGSGFMIGLPGQTIETIADDLLLLKELNCDMAGIGPFIPNPKTDLGNCKEGSTELTKRAVTIARLILPKAHLPATTSLGVLNIDAKNDIFYCGANVVMLKITPNEYKSNYAIYPMEVTKTDVLNQRKAMEEHIKALGFMPY